MITGLLVLQWGKMTWNDGTDGWSTVDIDKDGNITAKYDSDFQPEEVTMFGRNGKRR